MQSSDYNKYNSGYLDNLLKTLPESDIDPVTHKKKEGLFESFSNFFFAPKTDTQREAHQFLITYINNPSLKEKLKHDSKKIINLYDIEEAESYRATDDYYNLTLGFNERTKKLSESEKYKIVKIKFLNGESQFDQSEVELLKKWFSTQGAQKMKHFYEHFVIAGPDRKKQAEAYRLDSTLKQLFSAT